MGGFFCLSLSDGEVTGLISPIQYTVVHGVCASYNQTQFAMFGRLQGRTRNTLVHPGRFPASM